jgi:DNA-binding response OmpR family regulator
MARILLIEDNAPIRALLRENLVLEGHTVIEARDGQEGLDLFRQGGADLVITDILMPEKEGLAVLMELRNAQPPVNVIAIFRRRPGLPRHGQAPGRGEGARQAVSDRGADRGD